MCVKDIEEFHGENVTKREKIVTKDEISKLVKGFEKQDLLTSGGVTLAGQRYIYLSGTDRVIRAKLGKVGVHCMKTHQAVIVSIYEDPVQPQQAASIVEKLGDYLLTCGY
uniref:Profilin n=1 Tax=Lutzomyia longipalpis TaxID=7200 RepID=A0A1B0CP86_LUTLO